MPTVDSAARSEHDVKTGRIEECTQLQHVRNDNCADVNTDSEVTEPGPCHIQRAISTVSRASSISSGASDHVCRICWLGDEKEACIKPCRCSGSSAYVHPSCLRKWLHMANDYHCEICMFRYRTKRRLKPINKWRWWPSDSRSLSQLEATIILLGIVTPPLICGIILCAQKVVEYMGSDYEVWKVAALMTLIIASASTYLAAIAFFCLKFGVVCKMWIARNHFIVVNVAGMDMVLESKLPCGEVLDVRDASSAAVGPIVTVDTTVNPVANDPQPGAVMVTGPESNQATSPRGEGDPGPSQSDNNLWTLS